MEASQYPEIEIEKIIIPEHRAHAVLSPEQYKELKASIREHGFTVPIILRKLPDGRHELVDGENRINASKELKLTKLPYVLADSDEKKAQILNFQANWVRGFQNPVDVAECLGRAKKAGAEIDDLATWTGHTKQWVQRYIALNDIPDEFKEALRKGRIPVGIIWEAGRLPDSEEVYQTITTAIDLGWTIRECSTFVDNRLVSLRAEEIDEIEFTPEEFPSKEEALKMARLRTCNFCGGKYDVDKVVGGMICANCVDVLKAASEVASTPQEAARYIREVIKKDKERKLFETLKKKFEGPQPPKGKFGMRPE